MGYFFPNFPELNDNRLFITWITPRYIKSTLNYQLSALSLQLTLKGNARQVDYGKKYGETETSAWTICNIGGQYTLHIEKVSTLTFRAGVENLFDKRYTTYSDWCDIPQKGRNVYVNLVWQIL